MRYDLSKSLGQRQARAQLEHLIGKKAKIELTEKRAPKTYSQLKYLHVCIKAWGEYKGYRLEEMKQNIKAYIMPDIFAYQVNGKTFHRSMSDNKWFTKKKASQVIDRLQQEAMIMDGYYIPAPHETELLASLEEEAERYG